MNKMTENRKGVLDYIIDQCDMIESFTDYKLIIGSLKKDELEYLYNKLVEDFQYRPMCEYVSWKLKHSDEPKERKKNKPLKVLLDLFTDKKSKGVTTSRNALKDRFHYASYADQCKILRAFLASTAASDRDWAYRILYRNWYPTLRKDVQALWESNHELRCEWVVVKYFPKEYLYNNVDTFSSQSYKFVCVKLAGFKDFKMNRFKLSEFDYIYVCAYSGEYIEKRRVEYYLYKCIYDMMYEPKMWRYIKRDEDDVFTTRKIEKVNKILWCMSKLGMIQEIVDYYMWDDEVKKLFTSKCDNDDFNSYYVYRACVLSKIDKVCQRREKNNSETLFDFNKYDCEMQHVDKKATMEEMQALCPELMNIVEEWQLNEVKEECDDNAPF